MTYIPAYNSYYHREEIKKYNRSEWCSGRALAFKTIGRGFASRNCFFSQVHIEHILVNVKKRQNMEFKNRGRWFKSRQSFFFPDVDVGVAFQFIIQPREETSYKLLQMTHIKYTCR